MKLGGFIMRPFNRTVEKVLAWIANVLLIILTGYLTYGAFFQLDLVKNNPELIKQVREILARDPQVAIYSPEQFINLIVVAFKVYAVIYIILAILAVLATLLMGKRILSGIFFLLVAIAVGVTTVGILLPIYLLHFIVAIMLFVRKEPTTEFPEQQEQQETISYL